MGWLIGYAVAGLLAWILVIWWMVRRGWFRTGAGFEAVCAALFIPEVLLGLVFWPVFVPFLVHRLRDLDPEQFYGGEPVRAPELDRQKRDRETLVGRKATAVTDLRPSGLVILDRQRRDAVCRYGFVTAGETVRVMGADDLRLEVERLQEGTQ